MNDGSSQPIKALSELVDQAANRAASAFAEMLNLPVSVQLSQAELLEKDQVTLSPPGDLTWGKAVHLHFDDGATGEALFLLPKGHEISMLAELFKQSPSLGEESGDVILQEIGNVLLNACVGTISNQIGKHIRYQPPRVLDANNLESIIQEQPNQPVKLLRMLSTLGVGELRISAHLLLIFYTQGLGNFHL